MTIREQMHQVKEQSKRLASASLDERNELLARIREGLVRDWGEIASANAEDLSRADELAKELRLTDNTIQEINWRTELL